MIWNKLEILRNTYLKLGLSNAIDYEKYLTISIVYNSAKIERCSLSEIDTKLLLENNITAKGKSLSDHLMVKDHYNTLLFLKEISKERRKISIDLIKQVAGLVIKNTGHTVNAIGQNFDTSKGDVNKVENLLNDLVKNVNEKIDSVSGNEILKLSADIHYNLINIHPFGKGNGKTARLMMNYIRMYHNEPLIKIFADDRVKYMNALNKTEEKGDLSIFRDFICYQQIKFYKAELDKFKQKDKYKLLS